MSSPSWGRDLWPWSLLFCLTLWSAVMRSGTSSLMALTPKCSSLKPPAHPLRLTPCPPRASDFINAVTLYYHRDWCSDLSVWGLLVLPVAGLIRSRVFRKENTRGEFTSTRVVWWMLRVCGSRVFVCRLFAVIAALHLTVASMFCNCDYVSHNSDFISPNCVYYCIFHNLQLYIVTVTMILHKKPAPLSYCCYIHKPSALTPQRSHAVKNTLWSKHWRHADRQDVTFGMKQGLSFQIL